MSPVDQINPFRKPGPPNPGSEDRGNEPERSNEPNGEEDITLAGDGYGTSGPEVDWSKDRGRFDADANFSREKVELGVSGEEKQDLVDTKFFDVSASENFDIGIHKSGERHSLGGELNALEIEADVGTSGNELTFGAGIGVGGGINIVHGEDSDGDGQFEIGGEASFKLLGGGKIGFRVEPEAVVNRVGDVKDWAKDVEPEFGDVKYWEDVEPEAVVNRVKDQAKDIWQGAKDKAGDVKDWAKDKAGYLFDGDGPPLLPPRVPLFPGPISMRRLDEAFARLQSLL